MWLGVGERVEWSVRIEDLRAVREGVPSPCSSPPGEGPGGRAPPQKMF